MSDSVQKIIAIHGYRRLSPEVQSFLHTSAFYFGLVQDPDDWHVTHATDVKPEEHTTHRHLKEAV